MLKITRIAIPSLLVLFIAVRLISWLRRFRVDSDAYVYYIPSGIAYVKGALPTDINFEHPPLAKYIIGVFAIYLGGPNVSSLLFGVIAVVAALALAKKLLPANRSAWIVVWLLSFDQINMTISIDPMLDIFMLAFALLGFYFLLDLVKTPHFSLAGLCFGLAMASKWVALFLIIPALIFVILEHHKAGAGVIIVVAVATDTLTYLPLIASQGLNAYFGLQLQMLLYMLTKHGGNYDILSMLNRLVGPFIFISYNQPIYRLWQSHLAGNYFISLDESVNPFISCLTFPILYFEIRKYDKPKASRSKAKLARRLLIIVLGFFVAWYILFPDPFATWHYAPIDAIITIFVADVLYNLGQQNFSKHFLHCYLVAVAVWPLIATLIVT